MKISEFYGRIVGAEKPLNAGLHWRIETLGVIGCEQRLMYYAIPFNRNVSDSIIINDYNGKKVKITVEIED